MSEYRNQRGGFWVAGANPKAAAHSLTATWTRTTVAAAALLTDGAARYVDLFEASSWPAAMQQLSDEGPGVILKTVRELEASDPDRTRWKRSKMHDDATIATVILWGDTGAIAEYRGGISS